MLHYFFILALFFLRTDAAELPTPGTKKMAELLAKLRAESNPTNHPYLNQQRAEMWAHQIQQEKQNSAGADGA
jgi:hypothetical protein